MVVAPTRQSRTPSPSLPGTIIPVQTAAWKPRAPSAGGQGGPGGDTPHGHPQLPAPAAAPLPALSAEELRAAGCHRGSFLSSVSAPPCPAVPGPVVHCLPTGAGGAGAAHGARVISAVYSAATAPPAARRGGGSPGAPHSTTLLCSCSALPFSAAQCRALPVARPPFHPQRPRRSAERHQKAVRAAGPARPLQRAPVRREPALPGIAASPLLLPGGAEVSDALRGSGL